MSLKHSLEYPGTADRKRRGGGGRAKEPCFLPGSCGWGTWTSPRFRAPLQPGVCLLAALAGGLQAGVSVLTFPFSRPTSPAGLPRLQE